jgi:transcriptional regulator with XRE-family HTH domain
VARPNVVAPLVDRPVSDWNRLRIRAGLSIRELELKCGINRGTLSMIDSGRLHPTAAQSAKILEALRPDHPGAQLAPALATMARDELELTYGGLGHISLVEGLATAARYDNPERCPECGIGDAEYGVHARGCPSGFATIAATDPAELER